MNKQFKIYITVLSVLILGFSSTGFVSTQSAGHTSESGIPGFTDHSSIIATSTPLLLYLPLVIQNYPESTVCGGNSTTVVLLVDPKLATSIGSGLSQFEADLCTEGYTVIERVSNFSTPPEVRSYLANLYTRTNNRLEGAIFIGDTPRAYQWTRFEFSNPNIPPVEHEFISFQYYSDLDGMFSASPNYVSPGNHTYSYDLHSGNMNWEIWTGILPYYKGSITETINALNRYFAKNHSYRTGGYTVPRAYLEINELYTAFSQAEQDQAIGFMRDGPYSWTPFSNSLNARLYVNGPTLSVSQGYADLNAGMADFTTIGAHGSGQINIPWVESNPVNTVFFWSSGCAIGNIDQSDNFLTSIVYSSSSKVLIGKGTTNDSGGMGNNQNGYYGHNVAASLSQGKNFGQAILSHVNVPLIWPWSNDREYHFGLSIILGDPTLKLRP